MRGWPAPLWSQKGLKLGVVAIRECAGKGVLWVMRVTRGLAMRERVRMPAGVGCCPVCHDVLGSELVMLPCGHQLCCKCSMTIIDRAPQSASPQVLPHPCEQHFCAGCRLSGWTIGHLANTNKPRSHAAVLQVNVQPMCTVH